MLAHDTTLLKNLVSNTQSYQFHSMKAPYNQKNFVLPVCEIQKSDTLLVSHLISNHAVKPSRSQFEIFVVGTSRTNPINDTASFNEILLIKPKWIAQSPESNHSLCESGHVGCSVFPYVKVKMITALTFEVVMIVQWFNNACEVLKKKAGHKLNELRNASSNTTVIILTTPVIILISIIAWSYVRSS